MMFIKVCKKYSRLAWAGAATLASLQQSTTGRSRKSQDPMWLSCHVPVVPALKIDRQTKLEAEDREWERCKSKTTGDHRGLVDVTVLACAESTTACEVKAKYILIAFINTDECD
jgi:hypothetical protein